MYGHTCGTRCDEFSSSNVSRTVIKDGTDGGKNITVICRSKSAHASVRELIQGRLVMSEHINSRPNGRSDLNDNTPTEY